MLLQELQIWLRWVFWWEELLICWWNHGRCLYICEKHIISIDYWKLRILDQSIPLHTLSIVLTWLPSSIVCRVKSISGTGFFWWMARKALSTCTLFSMPAGASGVSGVLDWSSPSMMANGMKNERYGISLRLACQKNQLWLDIWYQDAKCEMRNVKSNSKRRLKKGGGRVSMQHTQIRSIGPLK